MLTPLCSYTMEEHTGPSQVCPHPPYASRWSSVASTRFLPYPLSSRLFVLFQFPKALQEPSFWTTALFYTLSLLNSYLSFKNFYGAHQEIHCFSFVLFKYFVLLWVILINHGLFLFLFCFWPPCLYCEFNSRSNAFFVSEGCRER